MIEKIKAIVDKNLPLISNLSNCSAVLNDMENINWCGFYLSDGKRLYLGPFQGEVACTIIPFERGVCGACARKMETVIVPNVNEFDGHIACSSLSKSEIVVPIIKDGILKGVIDIDSPVYDRFHENEKEELEEIAGFLSELF